MYDFEANPDDSLNPFPILDHSRLKGLNRSHPFTKALYRLPHNQLKYILQELNNAQGKKVDIGGYYKPNDELVKKAMRPSITFNKYIESLN